MQEWVQFYLPTKIHFENNCIHKLGSYLSQIGKRALILNIRSSKSKSGLEEEYNALKSGLEGHLDGCVTYDHLSEDPNTEQIDSAAYFANQSHADMIIALGSLKTLNAAKSIALFANNRIFSSEIFQKNTVLTYDALPIISLPIEPTMGEELTGGFFLYDDLSNKRFYQYHHSTIPHACFYDPKMTSQLSTDKAAKIAGSLVAYCIESFLNPRLNIFTEEILGKALVFAVENANNFYKEPYQEEFAIKMFCSSAFLGSCLDVCPLGTNWCLAYSLNIQMDIDFYLAIAVLLPYVMEYYLTINLDVYLQIAGILGIDTFGLSKIEAGVKAIEFVRKLYSELKLPVSLSELNVQKHEISGVIELTMTLPQINNAPKILSSNELEAILLSAI